MARTEQGIGEEQIGRLREWNWCINSVAVHHATVFRAGQCALRNESGEVLRIGVTNLVEVWTEDLSEPPRELTTGRHTKDLGVHHHFPGINGKIRVVEAPVKLLMGLGFVCGIVVWGNVFMLERSSCRYSLTGVEHQHLLQEVKR